MVARPYCVVVVLLLLAGVSKIGEGNSNPGFLARITKKGLEYAQQYAVTTLKKELSTTRLPDLSGSSNIDWVGWVSYDFHSLKIHHFVLQNWNLNLLPELGIRASLSNNYMSVGGNWKVNKAFITLQGTFDLKVYGISISVSLNLGKDQSGRPTALVTQCSNSIGHVSIDISGSLSWILNLFHERIENNIKMVLQQKPALSCLTVTVMIDKVASLDYRLVGAPQVTSEGLDIPFKGEFFSQSQPSLVPFEVPPMTLPPQHDHMIYLAVSEYMVNTASRVYHHAGSMKVIIRNEHLKNLTKLAANESAKKWRKQNLKPRCGASKSTPLTTMVSCFSSNFLLLLLQMPLNSPILLHTSSFQALIPQLARSYPNMEVELEASPESEPLLTFTLGNVTLSPVIDIQAFALLPNSSSRRPLFQLRVNTSVSITISVNSSRIVGSVTTGSKLKLELKQSNVSDINVELMETIFNYYALNTIYPSLNAKLEEGFPLPLPRKTSLSSVELHIHKNFLLLGANIN
ncbi:PREDICTED: lipopolysaccharide-binding protein-like [Chinchilla lanigera]|uniref:lipopolysaccharide-binding protein-like n=1 Tax=Chinchilla lanigera TaxID=34839 RepID=UPI00038E99A5|nr:PREDICTED: lipopolysaccharide-binding protein-like [Chinchilla lanigera]